MRTHECGKRKIGWGFACVLCLCCDCFAVFWFRVLRLDLGLQNNFVQKIKNTFFPKSKSHILLVIKTTGTACIGKF